MKSAYTLPLLIILVGCTGQQPPSAAAQAETLQVSSAALDDTVTVKLGQREFTRDRTVELSYVRLVSESRCPANVVCVWQGDAAIQVKAATAAAAVDTTIHTALDPRVLEIGRNKISLLEVQPYPGVGDTKKAPYIVVHVRR
jgi:hypothetical protein